MRSRLVLGLLAAFLFCVANAAAAAERRIALVIGESAYEGKPIETAANDAGLIAQTLQAAGFDVAGARDLDEDSLRGSLRDFLEKARNVGPDGVAFIYFAGAGAQLEGDNYLLPVGAPITRNADIPLHGARLSDYLKPLASMGLKTAVIVLDAARALPYPIQGQPLAGGLALYEPGPSLLLAFNAAPGTIAPPEPGPYGVYAHALAEMIRAGGMPIAQVFDQTRLRVLEATKGAQIPWNSQGFDSPFIFFERTSQAPPRGVDDAALRSRPIAQFSVQDAFAAAVARDTLQSYQDFLIAYPNDLLARRVRAILAARREALFWRKCRILSTPAAYWSYVRAYPHGPHVWDARRLLEIFASPPEPPPDFAPIDIGYPPPPPPEIVFVGGPVIFFGDPIWGFPPPPPPPFYFLPPPPPDFVVLPPPPVVVGLGAFVLPIPPFVPVPVYVQPPPFVVAPPGNVFFANIHNSVVVDASQNVVIANPQGRVLSATPFVAGAVAGAAGAAIGASLPRFIANKAALAPGGAVQPGQGFQRQGQSLPTQGQGLPTQGHGLPTQGPASGAQQPFQGTHALPQPSGNVLHGQSPTTQGLSTQGHGLPTQGPASGPQQPFQGTHALPRPSGNVLQGQSPTTQGLPTQGRHRQGAQTQAQNPRQSLQRRQSQGHEPQTQQPQGPNLQQMMQRPRGPGPQQMMQRPQGPGPQQMMQRPQGPGPQQMMQRPQGPNLEQMMQRPQGPGPQQMMQRPQGPGPQQMMMQRSQGPGPQQGVQRPGPQPQGQGQQRRQGDPSQQHGGDHH